MFERPRGVGINPPAGQIRKQRGNGAEIFAMIRPEIDTGTLPHSTGQQGEKRGLENAVLVVTLLRPRVGKQDPGLGEGDTRRQRVDGLPGFGLDEMAVRQSRALGFAFGAPNPVGDQVDAEADAPGELRRVTSQEMTMARADFERDGGWGGNEHRQRATQVGLALLNTGKEFGFGSHATF